MLTFDHFAPYPELLPHAVFRELASDGHQFNNDLSVVAADIRDLHGASAGV